MKHNPLKYMGMWDIDNIRVRFYSKNWVQFVCEHRVTNGAKDIKNVHFTLLDRISGVSFDDKVRDEFEKFVEKQKKKNQRIKCLKDKEREFRNLL